MTDTPEPKPCPICNRWLKELGNSWWHPLRSECAGPWDDCPLEHFYIDKANLADLAGWNRRADDERVGELLAVCEAVADSLDGCLDQIAEDDPENSGATREEVFPVANARLRRARAAIAKHKGAAGDIP